MELCGHATLASSFVILNFYEKDSDEVRFHTLGGGRIAISGEATLVAISEIMVRL